MPSALPFCGVGLQNAFRCGFDRHDDVGEHALDGVFYSGSIEVHEGSLGSAAGVIHPATHPGGFFRDPVEYAFEILIAILIGDCDEYFAGQCLRKDRCLFEGRGTTAEGHHLRSRGRNAEGDGPSEMRPAAAHSDSVPRKSVARENAVMCIHPSSSFFCSTCLFMSAISGCASSFATIAG